MSIKLDTLYRDINSRLVDAGIQRQDILHKDVINSINQAVSVVRRDYIVNGRADEFAETETHNQLMRDSDYPFLFSFDLDKTLMRSLPIEVTIRQSLLWKTSDELQDSAQSWSVGDTAIKEDKLYEAVSDISSSNTYSDTFKAQKVRNYRVDNGLKYAVGDVVYNQPDGTYWKCTSAYTNDQSETISASGSFTQLYWRELGEGFFEGSYIPFDRFYQTKLFDDIYGHYPFSVKDDTFYSHFSSGPVTISYIPEWEYVEDLSKKLDVSDVMERQIRDHALQDLARKLNVQVEFFNREQEDE